METASRKEKWSELPLLEKKILLGTANERRGEREVMVSPDDQYFFGGKKIVRETGFYPPARLSRRGSRVVRLLRRKGVRKEKSDKMVQERTHIVLEQGWVHT